MEEENTNRLSVVIRLAVICIAVIGLIVFLVSYKLENIEVKNGSYYTKSEIADRVFTRKTDAFTIFFYLRYKWFGLEDIPFVEQIDVELADRHTIVLNVYDKNIIGCTRIMERFMYFDRDGLVVESSDVRLEGIPEIKGLEFKDIVMYRKLDTIKSGLMDTILEITLLLDKNDIDAQAVCFSNRYEVSLEIGDDIVELGKADSYDLKINNINSVIGSLGEGSYLYNMKEYSVDHREVTARLRD